MIYLLIALASQILCQIVKTAVYSVKERRFAYKYFISSGGFPSAHSSFCVSVTGAAGWVQGFNSPLFGVAAVFSFIVMHDAIRLRGLVADQSRLLNKMQKDRGETGNLLNEHIGHTLTEVGAGALTGAAAVALAAAIGMI